MIRKKINRKKEAVSETTLSPNPKETRHVQATKSVQTWYQDHADTSVYSKKFNHKLQNKNNHQEDEQHG